MKINFHRVLLGFFENWDKSPQKKWDKGEYNFEVDAAELNVVVYSLEKSVPFWNDCDFIQLESK